MALNKEIWISQFLENFYPESNFLRGVTDMSGAVDANKLHIPSVGIDPKILVDNNTYPISIVSREDKDNVITLQRFETENTVVRHVEEVEYSYDKVESVIRQHKSTLLAAVTCRAAHAYAPNTNTTNTPIIPTTGEVKNNRLTMSLDDILQLKEMFDEMNAPVDGRALVLNPKHVSDLLRQDINLFKDITDLKDGKPTRFAGFDIYTFSETPTYTKSGSTYTKVAFGEAKTNYFSSIAFQKGEVMKADGDFFMFDKPNDPEQRGTIIGFEKRFVALPIRNMALGAIVSEPSL